MREAHVTAPACAGACRRPTRRRAPRAPPPTSQGHHERAWPAAERQRGHAGGEPLLGRRASRRSTASVPVPAAVGRAHGARPRARRASSTRPSARSPRRRPARAVHRSRPAAAAPRSPRASELGIHAGEEREVAREQREAVELREVRAGGIERQHGHVRCAAACPRAAAGPSGVVTSGASQAGQRDRRSVRDVQRREVDVGEQRARRRRSRPLERRLAPCRPRAGRGPGRGIDEQHRGPGRAGPAARAWRSTISRSAPRAAAPGAPPPCA